MVGCVSHVSQLQNSVGESAHFYFSSHPLLHPFLLMIQTNKQKTALRTKGTQRETLVPPPAGPGKPIPGTPNSTGQRKERQLTLGAKAGVPLPTGRSPARGVAATTCPSLGCLSIQHLSLHQRKGNLALSFDNKDLELWSHQLIFKY